MEPKTGLLILWILAPILAIKYRPTNATCNVQGRITKTKSLMEDILKKFLSANGNKTGQWPEEISELHLKNLTTKEKRHRAQCGLHYMQEAVKLIHEHQSNLKTANPIFNTTNIVLNRTSACVAHAIGLCTNKTKPIFSHIKTFERKQWGATVLNLSVIFLDDLMYFINHRNNSNQANHA